MSGIILALVFIGIIKRRVFILKTKYFAIRKLSKKAV